jgi:hypothetical protein
VTAATEEAVARRSGGDRVLYSRSSGDGNAMPGRGVGPACGFGSLRTDRPISISNY